MFLRQSLKIFDCAHTKNCISLGGSDLRHHQIRRLALFGAGCCYFGKRVCSLSIAAAAAAAQSGRAWARESEQQPGQPLALFSDFNFAQKRTENSFRRAHGTPMQGNARHSRQRGIKYKHSVE